MEMLSDKEIVLLQYLLKQSGTSALQESTQAKYDALHDKLGRMKAFQQSFAPDGAYWVCPRCNSFCSVKFDTCGLCKSPRR